MKSIKLMLMGIAIMLIGVFCAPLAAKGSEIFFVVGLIAIPIGLGLCIFGLLHSDDKNINNSVNEVYTQTPNKENRENKQ